MLFSARGDKSARESLQEKSGSSRGLMPTKGLLLKLSERMREVKGCKTERDTERSEKSTEEERRKNEMLGRELSYLRGKQTAEKQHLEKKIEQLQDQNERFARESKLWKKNLVNAKEELRVLIQSFISIQEVILKSNYPSTSL